MIDASKLSSRTSLPWIALVPPALAVLGVVRGLRAEYLAIAALFAALIAIGPRTRRFAEVALPFAAVGLIYDHFMWVSWMRGQVHVGDLHAAELALFGIPTANGVVTPTAFLSARTHAALDFVCGFSYLAYLYEVFFVGAWLHFTGDEARAKTLAWAFLLVNVIGMLVWLVYPAAPPWYVELYGTGPARLDVPASAAGAARFDALLGITYFHEFYARSKNVFGAMPSLHVAYPALVFFVLRDKGRLAAWLAAGFALLVAYSALYLGHHYVLDVLGGALAAFIAFAIVRSRMKAPEIQA